MDSSPGPMSPSLAEKARRELNEDPNTRRQEIAALRERLLRYTGLTPRVDDAFLIKFLRARKFDQERTFELVLNYYQMKKDNEDIFAEMTPKHVQHILKMGVTTVLPHRGREGEAILLLRGGRWDPDKHPMMDLFRANFVVLTNMIECESTQVSGVRIIDDHTGIGWKHAKSMSPTMAKKITHMLQDAFPMRLKGIHYVHEPVFIDYVYALVKPFLKEKLQKRLNFHGSRVEELHKYIDPAHLPQLYKGTQPLPEQTTLCERLLESESKFEENAKYGFVSMTIHPETKQSEDAIEELPGTFKQISIN